MNIFSHERLGVLFVSMSPSAGEALTFAAQYLLTPAAGRRPMVPGVVVIIGDKKSSDNLTLGTSNLRAAGGFVQKKSVKRQNLRLNMVDHLSGLFNSARCQGAGRGDRAGRY